MYVRRIEVEIWLQGKDIQSMKRQITVIDIGIFILLLVLLTYLVLNQKEMLFIGIATLCTLIWSMFLIKKMWKLGRKSKIKSIQLLSEQEKVVKEWYITDEKGLLIGKSCQATPVDIDLSEAEYAVLIEKVHASLNCVKGIWYLEDMDSRNGTGFKSKKDTTMKRLESREIVRINPGDRILIARAVLQLVG